MSRIRRMPSPALVVSIVALVAALAGTAVAQDNSGGLNKSIVKKIAKKQANKQINKRLPIDSSELADGAVTSSKLGAINTRRTTITVPDGGYAETTAQCQAGERALSGGVAVDNPAQSTFTPIVESHKEGEAWHARVFNGSGTGAHVVHVEVYCLS